MRCLIDYIGIEGCNAAAGEVSLYINRLIPGLPLQSWSAIAEPEQETYLQVWSDLQERSARRFETLVTQAFSERYRLRTVLESTDVLKFIDTSQTTPSGTNATVGLVIMTAAKNTNRLVSSALQHIYIQELSYYATAGGSDIVFKIWNLETGTLLGTHTIATASVQANAWNTINVNTRYYAYRIAVSVDCYTDLVQQSISSDVIRKWVGGCCGFWNDVDCGAGIRGFTSEEATGLTDDNITLTYDTNGVTGVFSIGCSFNDIVCQTKDRFTLAWAYLLAVEMMMTRKASSAINRWTVGIDATKAAELQVMYENLMQQELQMVISGIDLNGGDCCLDCNAPIVVRENRM